MQCLSQALYPLSKQTSDAASSAGTFGGLGCGKVFQKKKKKKKAHTSGHMAVMPDQLAEEPKNKQQCLSLSPVVWRGCFMQLNSGNYQNVQS